MRLVWSEGRCAQAIGLCLFAFPVAAAEIVNPGFEDGWGGWTDGDPSGSGTALSDVAYSGERSVKLVENGTYVAQTVAVQPDSTYRLRVKAELNKVRLPFYLHYVLFFVSLWDFETEWHEIELDLATVLWASDFRGPPASVEIRYGRGAPEASPGGRATA